MEHASTARCSLGSASPSRRTVGAATAGAAHAPAVRTVLIAVALTMATTT